MFLFISYSEKVKTTGRDDLSGFPEIEKGGRIDYEGVA